jgi:sialic acid synthase SpsE
MKAYIFAIGEAYKALGSGDKSPLQREQEIGRRDGIYLTRNMSKGETISFEDIQVKRPAIGLRSRYITLAVGATLNQSVEKDQPLTWNLLSF